MQTPGFAISDKRAQVAMPLSAWFESGSNRICPGGNRRIELQWSLFDEDAQLSTQCQGGHANNNSPLGRLRFSSFCRCETPIPVVEPSVEEIKEVVADAWSLEQGIGCKNE